MTNQSLAWQRSSISDVFATLLARGVASAANRPDGRAGARSLSLASPTGYTSVYAIVIAAALGLVPYAAIATDQVDVVELNHFYDQEGGKVFDQVIFWEWHEDEAAYHVVAWRLWKSPTQTPLYDWAHRSWLTLWEDGPQLRLVRATSFRETWTQFDPEAEDRAFLPVEHRRGLSAETSVAPVTRPSRSSRRERSY